MLNRQTMNNNSNLHQPLPVVNLGKHIQTRRPTAWADTRDVGWPSELTPSSLESTDCSALLLHPTETVRRRLLATASLIIYLTRLGPPQTETVKPTQSATLIR
jgi:hypothetical protein